MEGGRFGYFRFYFIINSSSITLDQGLVYRTRSEGALEWQFAWFDRAGNRLENVGEPQAYLSTPALSTDEGHLAFRGSSDGRLGIRIVDLRTGEMRSLPAGTGGIGTLWSPDGGLAGTTAQGPQVQDLESDSPPEPLLATTRGLNIRTGLILTDWSADGRYVLMRNVDHGGFDIWAADLEGDRTAFEVVVSPFDERDAQFSPDAAWIAYQSHESGRYEIYVQGFPDSGDRIGPVSTGGGVQVRWGPNGDELFYLSLEGQLMSVPVTLGPTSDTIEIGSRSRCFKPRSEVFWSKATSGTCTWSRPTTNGS